MKHSILLLFRAIFFFYFLSAIFFTPAAAQNKCTADCSCQISGSIVDIRTTEPVPYATIKIQGSNKGTLADENGHFTFTELCQAEFDLAISHIGYKSVVHHHDIYHKDLIVKLAPGDIILESVVIEGETTAAGLESLTASKLSGKDLETLKNESLGEALGNITGVSTLKTGSNIVNPIIHGLHSNRVLIINNGVRHESQRWGMEHAPEIDPALADHITLVKGAAAVKYGPAAMGGVIIIDPPTMELSTEHLHGEAGISAASNGRALGGDILLQRGYSKFAWMGQISGRKQGDLRSPAYQLTNTGARKLSYTLGSRFHQGKFDVSLYYSHVQQQLGILRGSVVGNLDDLNAALKASKPFYTTHFSYDINNPRQQVSHDLMRLKAHYNVQNSRIDLQYSFQANHRREFDVRRGSNNEKPAIDLELMTHSIDLDWQHAAFHGWTGTVGGQWLYQDNNNLPGTNTIPFVPNFNNSRFGFYIIESRPMGDINFETGIRYDYQWSDIRGRDIHNNIYRNNLSYQSVTGLVGINFNVGKNSTLQSNIGTAWRPPNIAELYSYGKHGFIIDYGLWRQQTDDSGNTSSSTEVFNQNERPVKNELGMKWINTYTHTTNDQSLVLTAYVNYLANYIYSRPAGITQDVRGPFPYYVYEQTNALFYGLDASYIINHTDAWQSQIKGSYLEAVDVSNDDYFTGMPSNQITYQISYDAPVLSLERFQASIDGSYTFKQYNAPRVITVAKIKEANSTGEPMFITNTDNFDFVPAPAGYLLVNARIYTTVDQFILGFQVNNALDKTYRSYTNMMRYFADEPGINFLLSVRYKF